MIKGNLEAIALLKNLQADNREPSKEEKEIPSKFNGWGAMWQIFKPDHPEHSQLKSLLTPEEFAQANASILNAHYTHPDIVKAMWEAVSHLGFDRGKVLEPSCAIGYFMTHAPRWNLWTAIELDPIPAEIAAYLNPSATIYNQGFEKISLPDQYFDMAIGNVPFGSYSVFEPRYDGLLIHNHFISKSIDLVREGGLIALITSTGTLDAEGNEEFRRSLSEKAKLIAAIRMPGGTMSNAKTQVTTDLLIFKREPEPQARWIVTGDGQWMMPINQYFLDYPEHILGEVCKDKLYGNARLAVKVDGRDIPSAIALAIKEISPCYVPKQTTLDIQLIPNELQSLPVNAFCVWKDKLYQRTVGKLIHLESNRMRANLKILFIVEELLDRQLYETNGKNLGWHQIQPDSIKASTQIGDFGILEPKLDLPPINLSKVDVILVPAIAIDEHGNRLVYGGGFYDRFLLKQTGIKIGIIFADLYLKALPHAPWDLPVDYICTENVIKSF